MKITINIPKEFEEHFERDRFKGSLERIYFDVKEDAVLSGLYELETLEMLKNTLGKAEVASKEKWISCSEELPTDKDYGKGFLATIQCEHIDGLDDYITGVAEWEADGWYIMSDYIGQIKVVAWQRMPAPYRG